MSVCVSVSERERECVCVCVCVRARARVSVCVCVGGGGAGEVVRGERARARVPVSVSMSVCAHRGITFTKTPTNIDNFLSPLYPPGSTEPCNVSVAAGNIPYPNGVLNVYTAQNEREDYTSRPPMNSCADVQ